MSASALSIAVFDPEHGVNVSARSGATLIFRGSEADVRDDGPEVETTRKGWSASLGDAFSVKLEPVADAAELGGITVHVCAVSGRIDGQKARCLGTVSETSEPPAWDELDLMRSVAIALDRDNAFLAVARRPRGAPGHDADEIAAWLLSEGAVVEMSEARISTVYDGEGRQRSAGLELWVPGEDYPRRGSGSVVAGTSLALDEVDVHAAAFRWRLDDLEGAGSYELWLRRQEEAA